MYRLLRNFCVLVLGSITSFSSRAFHPGSSSNRPFACTFTANPRPSGELILDGKVKASLIQMTPNSGNSWTVSYPIQSITVEEGGNYACVAKMGSVSIVSYAQLGSELDQITSESFLTSVSSSHLCNICSTTSNIIRSRKNEDTDLQWHGISYTVYHMGKDTWKSNKADSRQ